MPWSALRGAYNLLEGVFLQSEQTVCGKRRGLAALSEEIKEKKGEIKEQEERLLQRENNIDRRDLAMQNRENSLEERENNL